MIMKIATAIFALTFALGSSAAISEEQRSILPRSSSSSFELRLPQIAALGTMPWLEWRNAVCTPASRGWYQDYLAPLGVATVADRKGGAS